MNGLSPITITRLQLSVFQFLLSGYFRSVDACVVAIVSDHFNQSSSALFFM